ncbi:hypothetical protein FACS1894188_11520 [Clostridia bacterium]|nr:hypothetical protein FACS1894188_11520 [Clostridia bacterium]
MAMGKAEIGESENYKVTWKTSLTKTLDTKAVKKAMPELYDEYPQITTKRTFLFKEAK